MRDTDKRGRPEMEGKKKARMNNSHQVQHVRHRHTERSTSAISSGWLMVPATTYLLFSLCVSTARPRDSIEKEKTKERCHYRSFKCFYVSTSPDKHFNLLLLQLFSLFQVPIYPGFLSLSLSPHPLLLFFFFWFLSKTLLTRYVLSLVSCPRLFATWTCKKTIPKQQIAPRSFKPFIHYGIYKSTDRQHEPFFFY